MVATAYGGVPQRRETLLIMYFVYILKSVSKDKYYIGSSSNVQKRLDEHNRGKTRSTKPYAPYELVYTEAYKTRSEAL